MLGSLTQADTASLQTPFLVFSILILSALVIGALSYMQLSNKFYKAKDDLRKALTDLKKAVRYQRKYQKLRKQARKDKNLKQALKSAMEASGTCFYLVDLQTQKVKFGKNVDAALGLQPGEARLLGLEKLDVYNSFIHPDDLPAVMESMETLTEGKTTYSHFYRLVLPGGTRLIKSSGEVTSRGGMGYRMVGFIQDVDALRASHVDPTDKPAPDLP